MHDLFKITKNNINIIINACNYEDLFKIRITKFMTFNK